MDNRNKKKSGKGIGVVIGILILLLARFSDDFDSDVIGPIVALAIVGVLVVISIRIARASPGSARQNTGTGDVGHSMKRHEPKVEIHRAFPEPEAHCVVCENTGDNHFDRDRQMRLKQLDDWLKNGLIDREEYAVLKRKYEQS